MQTYFYKITHHGSYNEQYHGKIFKITASNIEHARMNIGKKEGIILGRFTIDVWPKDQDESDKRNNVSSDNSSSPDGLAVVGALAVYGALKLTWMAGKGLTNLAVSGVKSYQEYKKNQESIAEKIPTPEEVEKKKKQDEHDRKMLPYNLAFVVFSLALIFGAVYYINKQERKNHAKMMAEAEAVKRRLDAQFNIAK